MEMEIPKATTGFITSCKGELKLMADPNDISKPQ